MSGKGGLDVKTWRAGTVAADAARFLREQWAQATTPANHMAFLGSPMSKEEVEAHYPDRPSIVTCEWQNLQQLKDAAEGEKPLPLFHFKRLHIDDPEDDLTEEVKLGDCVSLIQHGKLDPEGNTLSSVMRITELFVDAEGERYFRGLWFYDALDTIMAHDVPLSDEVAPQCKAADADFDGEETNARTMPCELTDQQQRLWLASDRDNNDYSTVYNVACIDKVVRVFHVTPGRKVHEQYAEYDPDVDRWYNQVHTCQYNTLEDLYQDWSLWSSHYKMLLEAGGLAAVRALRQKDPTTLIRGGAPGTEGLGLPLPKPHEGPPVLKCLDIFAGAGGLSFLHQRNSSGSVDIRAGWAVDINTSAAATYAANHPEAAVYSIGLDEFLWLLRLWSGIVVYYLGRDWQRGQPPSVTQPPPRPGKPNKGAVGQGLVPQTEQPQGEVEVEEVVDVRVQDNAPRHKDTSNKGQLVNGISRDQCWLELLVVPKGGGERQWVRAAALSPASFKVVQAYVLAKANKGDIPQPGDVALVAGGPPCQDVSGLNRHAKQQDVLGTPKNRLVATYFDLVDFLEPRYILIEQVTDIFKKERGLYARFAVCLLVEHGYQTRVGVVTAGEFGVAQGRRRVFFWGARSGRVQLPPLPASTHHCKDFCTGHPNAAKQCIVTALAGTKLHPMITLGDILSDLPDVHNYCFSDRAHYRSDPQTPAQAFLRRSPPAGTLTGLQRAAAADARMKVSQDLARVSIQETRARGGLAAVGQTGFCKKAVGAKGVFAVESVDAHLAREVPGGGEDGSGGKGGQLRWWKELLLEMDREHTKIALGQTMLDQFAAAEGVPPDAPLRDHRPLQNNMDDFSRMCAVPREYLANFRDMAGVVTHADGTCCAGSWHASASAQGCACPGGGIKGRPGSNNKKDRVDQYGAVDCADSEEEEEGQLPGAQKQGQEGAGTQADLRGAAAAAGGGGGGAAAGSSRAGAPRGPRSAAAAAQAAAVEAMTQAASGQEGQQEQQQKGKVRLAAAAAAAAVGGRGGSDPSSSGAPLPPQRATWRGSQLLPCPSRTMLLGTNDLLAPRWVVMYKRGKSQGRHGCYGRAWYGDIQPTVVGRAEPHNLQLLHPEQDRVLSIRENARCQGFPDYYALVGLDSGGTGHGLGGASVHQRYLQMGNAVAPPVAAALGRCLLMAAEGVAPVGEPVVFTPDPEYEAIVAEARAKGQRFWSEDNEVPEVRGNSWKRHLPEGAVVEEEEDEDAPEAGGDQGGDGGDSDGGGPQGGRGKGKGGPKVTRGKGTAAGGKPKRAPKPKAPAQLQRHGQSTGPAAEAAAAAAGPSGVGGNRAGRGGGTPVPQGRKRVRTAAPATPAVAAPGMEATQPGLAQQQQQQQEPVAGHTAAAGVAGNSRGKQQATAPASQLQQEQQPAKKQRLSTAAAAAAAAAAVARAPSRAGPTAAVPQAKRNAARQPPPPPQQQQQVGGRDPKALQQMEPEGEEADAVEEEVARDDSDAAAAAASGELGDASDASSEEVVSGEPPSSSSGSEMEEEEEDSSDGSEDDSADDVRICRTAGRRRAAAVAARGQQIGGVTSSRRPTRAAAGAAAAAAGGGCSRPRRSSAAAVTYIEVESSSEEDVSGSESERESDMCEQSEGHGEGSSGAEEAGCVSSGGGSSQQQQQEVEDGDDQPLQAGAATGAQAYAPVHHSQSEEEGKEEQGTGAVARRGSSRPRQAAAARGGVDSDKENRPSPAAAAAAAGDDDCGRSPTGRKRPAAAAGVVGSTGKRVRGGPPRAAATPELLLAGVDLEKRSESPVVHAGASMLSMPNSAAREADRDVC